MNSTMPKEIHNFPGPEPYRDYCQERGLGVSTAFCHATSQIMKKYKLTFPQACGLLEAHGYLFWVGKIPVYNLRGDLIWSKEPSEKNRQNVMISLWAKLRHFIKKRL